MSVYRCNLGEHPKRDKGYKRLEGRIHDVRETTALNGARPNGNTSV